jgi:hypothetical protein
MSAANNAVRPGKRRRRGFALPLAILALALMTATIVAAYSSTNAETVANNAMRSQERALQLAQTGLQQFYVRRSEAGFCSNCVSDPSVADSEWTRVTLPGGYADVVAMRQRSRFSSLGIAAVYFIRSTGVDTGVRLSGAGNVTYSRRTIGQYATWGTTPVRVMGGITSLNGLRNNNTGGSSRIDGSDECSTDPDVAGAVVPKGGTYGGTGPAPAGTPAVDSSMTLDSLRKVIGIDWNGILNSNLIPADYTIPGSTFPSAFWFAINSTAWPVIRIRTNNYSIPNDGRGIIIADSNIVFPSGADWDGVVLIGGIARATGSGAIDGVLVTGLNKLLASHPNPYDFSAKDTVNTTKRVRYSSCNAEDSADKLKIYFAMMNTFMDNVAIW